MAEIESFLIMSIIKQVLNFKIEYQYNVAIKHLAWMNSIFVDLTKFIFVVTIVFSNSAFANNVVLNKSLSKLDPRYQYTYNLMSLILEVTPEFGGAEVETSAFYMTRNRALIELKSGELINVMAEAPKQQWDENLIVIPIPIRKGIQGLRIFIIEKENKTLMQNIDTLAELMNLPSGTGAHWSTRTAMENAGFDMVTGSNYDGLFGMLNKGRFLTFGRGINEAYKEVQNQYNKYPNFTVDKSVLLHIPLATYFYVSPKTPEIAERIKVGLLRLIENGTFDLFFYKNHCKDLLKAQINKRKVFRIPNSLVSKERMLSLVDDDYLIDAKTDFSTTCQ